MNALLELQADQIKKLQIIEDDLAAGVGDPEELWHDYQIIRNMITFTARQIGRRRHAVESPEDYLHLYGRR